ncbi:hypothetical protein H4R34_001948 [Dimargaris verticillata]|uniref:Uncharacterized protein n=1 Tax=Dimargaris verticillata TaxID=2761393 RepID=A0A9W8EEI8_9FUNG|nr:hypothetical protein H4R34_001948 [Dimargaris verticillata]
MATLPLQGVPIAVICLYIFIRSVNGYLVKPIPLRLAFFASFVEIIFSVLRLALIGSHQASSTLNQAECGSILFFFINGSLLSLFIRILLPIHLLKILFFKQYHVPFYERQYLVLCFFASTILSFLPIASSVFGWTEMAQRCGPHATNIYDSRSDRVNMLLWKWASYYAWIVLLVVFCLGVFLVLLVQLVRDRLKLRHAFKSGPAHLIASDEANKFWILIRKIIQRILWYPLIAIFCHVVELYNAFQQISGQPYSPAGFFLSQLFLSLQAVFTLIVFLFEPSLREAYREKRSPGVPSRSLRQSASLATPSDPHMLPWDIVIQTVEPKPSQLSPAFEFNRVIV